MPRTLLSRTARLLLVAVCVASGTAHAQVARNEIHPLASLTAPERQFLGGTPQGTAATIAGDLRLPRGGSERLPAVVLLHGTGGVTGSITEWESEFHALGLATFRVDSFSGRGLVTTFDDQDRFGRLNLMYDAWRAFELLEKHPRIDPERIALIGFSLGGQATVAAAMKRFQRLHGPASRREFATYLPFYPQCNLRYARDAELSGRPIRWFHGSADDWAPVAPCRAYVEEARSLGADLVMTEYADAHHVFDWPALRTPLRIASAQAVKGCRVQESAEAILTNADSGAPFSWKDPCVTRGATVAYDERATAAARQAVRQHLVAVLRP